MAQLGMQGEFAQMLDYLRQNLSGLQRIEVELAPPYDTGDEDKVVIHAYRDPAIFDEEPADWRNWSDWLGAAMSPDVFRHFTLTAQYRPNHAG